jgi:hypothetical protein
MLWVRFRCNLKIKVKRIMIARGITYEGFKNWFLYLVLKGFTQLFGLKKIFILLQTWGQIISQNCSIFPFTVPNSSSKGAFSASLFIHHLPHLGHCAGKSRLLSLLIRQLLHLPSAPSNYDEFSISSRLFLSSRQVRIHNWKFAPGRLDMALDVVTI